MGRECADVGLPWKLTKKGTFRGLLLEYSLGSGGSVAAPPTPTTVPFPAPRADCRSPRRLPLPLPPRPSTAMERSARLWFAAGSGVDCAALNRR